MIVTGTEIQNGHNERNTGMFRTHNITLSRLRLLSGLAAWVFCKTSQKTEQVVADQTLSWYEATSLGKCCESNTHCKACRMDGDCDACDTIDGRWPDIKLFEATSLGECCGLDTCTMDGDCAACKLVGE